MNDDNWELINGPAAHYIEQLNATNTINAIEALVVLLTTHAWVPTELALCELHRTGTFCLLHLPGHFRAVYVDLRKPDGTIAYVPPDHTAVPGLITEFIKELQAVWATGDALDVAAFALWRVNWIHPFKNGNGRTARAFAYTCLCAKLGVILPGQTTIVDQIMLARDRYEQGLREADAAAARGERDLTALRSYLDDLLQIQIASVP